MFQFSGIRFVYLFLSFQLFHLFVYLFVALQLLHSVRYFLPFVPTLPLVGATLAFLSLLSDLRFKSSIPFDTSSFRFICELERKEEVTNGMEDLTGKECR